jgi:hypothetical protein
MAINVSDNNPRVNYTATSGQTVFTVSFEFFEESDLTVYINGTEKTLTTDYTVTGGDGSTGTITLVTGATASDKVAIVRDVAIQRTTDFNAGQDINRAALNEQLDTLTALVADIDDRASRALQLNDYEVAVGITLPATNDRKGKVLGFNATTGDVESGPEIADVQSLADVSADIATLADIEDGTDATDAIQTVAGISSDVTTVSGISGNVTTVAGISSDVTAVAADATDIGTVATNIASVNTVATNIADVITVANDLNEAVSEVVTVADDLNEAVSEIDTVAGSISNVDTVGTNIADVNTVAGISANVTTVAGISSDTTTVADISANVTTVAGISSDVTAVAADATDIGTVATDISNVNAVAGNSTNINAVAGNATNINAVAGDEADIGTVAGISANVTTVAGLSSSVSTLALISSDITTVAGISANVTTVAGDTANIATIATNLNGTDTIGTVAGSISNVNAVGSAISDVSTVASNLTDVQSFANTYRIGATDPTTSLDTGDLFYNTTSSTLKVYTGSGWEQGVTAGSGFLPLSGGTLTGGLTLSGDPSTNLQAATKQYVDNEVAGIVDSAPATLDTLNELAAALGDDANFSTTVTNNIATKVSKSGDTMTGNLSFGDNNKAIFGTGSDLQIYHDGNHSYISDQGTGRLYLRASNDLFISDAAGAKHKAVFTTNGAVSLRYDGSQKLATTSTGVDITGTLTSDGLTVDGDLKVTSGSGGGLPSTQTGLNVFGGTDVSTGAAGTITVGNNSNSIASGNVLGRLQVYSNDASTSMAGNVGNIDFVAENSFSGTAETAITFSTNNSIAGSASERMRIDSSGNVGIGTSSPNTMLHVKSPAFTDSTIHIDATSNNVSQRIDFRAAGTLTSRIYDDVTKFELNAVGNKYMRFKTNDTERMRIDSSGNLLVGKTVVNNDDNGLLVQPNGNSWFTATGNYPLGINRKTSDGALITLTKDQSTVGTIGTLSSRLHIENGDTGLRIAGDLDQIFPCGSGGADRGSAIDLGSSGVKFKDGHFSGTVNAANFNTTSDATLKTNVETLTGSLDAVKAMRGVSFDWIENGNSEVGVIAQEVEEVIPDVVSTNDQGIKSVKYGNLVGVLIEAIKEQQQRIEALEARLGD